MISASNNGAQPSHPITEAARGRLFTSSDVITNTHSPRMGEQGEEVAGVMHYSERGTDSTERIDKHKGDAQARTSQLTPLPRSPSPSLHIPVAPSPILSTATSIHPQQAAPPPQCSASISLLAIREKPLKKGRRGERQRAP